MKIVMGLIGAALMLLSWKDTDRHTRSNLLLAGLFIGLAIS